jgi:hypothetical protein
VSADQPRRKGVDDDELLDQEVEEGVDDLAGVDLDSLDLDGIDLDEADGDGGSLLQSGWGRIAYFLTLLSGGAFVLWLPSTEWFRLGGHNSPWFFVVCGLGMVDGLLLGRLVWRWAQEVAARPAPEPEPTKPKGPPSAVVRWLTLAAALGGAAAIIFGVPASAYYSEGDAYHSTWFLGAGGALVIGILLGRWLLMQATAKPVDDTPRQPIKLPPWFKWVTLGVLIALALVAFFGNLLYGNEEQGGNIEFPLGAIGFVVGLAGAIWLARRFDEFEAKHTRKPEPLAGSERVDT